ncbi:MAG: divergent polysaccharide deacetylase family protein [Motiliproteus sp.]
MNQRLSITALLLGKLLLWPLIAQAQAQQSDSVGQPALVILIDDVGDNFDKGQAAIQLPGPVTYAVLPHSPHGKSLAKQAVADGKEVMLHAPMENTHDRPLGPGALTADLNKYDFLQILKKDLDSVPGAVGLNNHMGSLLTQLRPQMGWVMEVIKQRQLFFLDSRTTSETVAWKVAKEYGIPYLRRDVFLDHERTPEFVHGQFQLALKMARDRGVAVVIGHPYPVTVNYLKQALPQLDEMGIRLVTASALLLEQAEEKRLAEFYQRQKQRAEQHVTIALCEGGQPSCNRLAAQQDTIPD